MRRIFFMVVLAGVFVTSTGMAQEESAQELAQQAEEAFAKGDYDQAIKSYELAVEKNPNFAPLYNALGLAHQARNDRLSDVLWFFDVAVDIDPKYAEAFNNKCRILYRAGKHDEAEGACRQALAISPDLTSAQLNLGWIYLIGKKQPQDAVFYFQKVLEKMKKPMVYFGLGMAYAQKEDTARVLDIVTTLRSLGENALATQLENSIRKPDEVPPREGAEAGMLPPLVEHQPGMLIKAGMAAPESGVTGAAEPPVSPGMMRIRLKGRLSTADSPDSSSGSSDDSRHPGSLSPSP